MASPGTWMLATYQQMPYFVLLPDGYNAALRYPVILFLHQYQADSGQPAQTNPWFNTAQFRADHPCIVIVPLCVIGAQKSTPTFNWGGVDQNLQQPIVLALAILDQIIAQYGGDPNRLYITGNSMGGLGTWGVLCNPSQRGRFAAAMPVSGSCYYNIGNEPAIAAALKDFPIWSCHGQRDTQVSPAFDQAIMPMIVKANATSRFTNDPAGQHDTWDSFYPDPSVWTWLFAQHKGGSALAASPDRSTVMAGSAGTIIDASGNSWSISASAQVAINGVSDTATSNVTELAWVHGLLWQCNVAGKWYAKSAPTQPWSTGTSVNPLNPPAGFSIQGGKIIDPEGNPWTAAGINNRPMDPSNATKILQMFPGITFVRLAMEDFEGPAAWSEFIAIMEAAKVVCLKEYHPWPMKPALSGSDLAAEATAAGQWAAFYRGRPYLWIGSMNEPQSGDMTPEHIAVYNAVRAADPNKIVVFIGGIGGGNPGATGSKVLNPAAYAPMKNIVWDLHYYGWGTKFSTDQATNDAALMGSVASASGIAALKAIRSADGEVPVIIGEFGPSTSGTGMDANAAQVLQAVTSAAGSGRSQGYAGWAWGPDPFNALQSGGQPTQWGRNLAAAIALSSTNKQPPPPPPPPPPPGPTMADLIKQFNAALTTLATVSSQLSKLGG